MKYKILTLLVISFFAVVTVSGQSNGKKVADGTWKFEAPYAPEGFTTGTIVVGKAENKPTATMSFTGSEYKLPGESVKTSNDSLFFSIYLEGEDIQVKLKLESDTKMTGKASYSQGDVPLTLSKVTDPDKI
jgi:hypothetical protein